MDETEDRSNSICSSEECFDKLEKLKHIRQKTLQIEKLKIFIKNSVREAEEEKQALQKYRKEIGLLLQEKMAHVEELRLIHTDINTMENLIKQSALERGSLLHEAKKQLEQYKPLKIELDALRQDVGLSKSEPLDVDEVDFVNETLTEKEASKGISEKSPAADTMFVNETPDKMPIIVPDNNSSSHPPPMKLCGSCHQYIHRNAPICPLCKAKSRSRNPKKLKKTAKTDE